MKRSNGYGLFKWIPVFCFTLLLAACANSQQQPPPPVSRLVGGPCEGCEAIFEYGNKPLLPVDTLPDFATSSTPLKLTGTIYQPDGKTPAPGVILYIYHTDASGVYPTRGNETGWARRHGYLRGWIKTGGDGKYTFYTSRPGQYPSRTDPAHIHATVQEPDGRYYYLHDYYFIDDPLLSKEEVAKTGLRGGDKRILTLQPEGSLWVGVRDIVLGSNVPGYK